ncbi:putative uncharacterized protein (plasmid) [Aliivibrio wodanis]|uniref:Uncharacterized protein n=1 Tax=Aliivibrio wodanis TaxID=80852 RepID=A0A090I8P0_9GAMM|nr:putative uncharacterized protein [Aliivibrio wodanis]
MPKNQGVDLLDLFLYIIYSMFGSQPNIPKIYRNRNMTYLISTGTMPVKLRPNFRRIPSPLHIMMSVRVCLEGVSDVRS